MADFTFKNMIFFFFFLGEENAGAGKQEKVAKVAVNSPNPEK